MRKVEIKLSELPKYKFDSIINNMEKEFGVDIDKNNNIIIDIFIDRNSGINATITNKFNVSKKNKNELLRYNLIEFLNAHISYQFGYQVDIKTLYENYKNWCIQHNISYYQNMSFIKTDWFTKFLSDRGMSTNNNVIFNAIYGIVTRL